MLINNKNNNEITTIKMNEKNLQQVKSIKYLGVIIDDKLDFKENFDYVCEKVSKKVSFLGRISKKLDFTTKILIYITCIAPHIDYCSTILLLNTDTELQRLQKIQNKAMRIIPKVNRYTPIKTMLDILQWQTIKQRICYNTMIMIQKIKNGTFPEYLKKELTNTCNEIEYNLRNEIKRLDKIKIIKM